jgi:putative oxidoreductase
VIPLSNEQPGRLVATTRSAVRAVVGVLFACHGAAGLFGILGGISPNGGTFPFGFWPGWWVCLCALIGGTMVAIGLYTRATAALCSAMMAYVYVTIDMPHALLPTQSGGEPAALYCLVFLLIVSIGAGSYAVDTVIRQYRRASEIRRYLDTGDVVGISISD